MKRIINPKLSRSLLPFIFGFLAASVLFLVLGASGQSFSAAPKYQISTSSDGSSVFILETETGKLWRRNSTVYRYYGTPENPEYKSKNIPNN